MLIQKSSIYKIFITFIVVSLCSDLYSQIEKKYPQKSQRKQFYQNIGQNYNSEIIQEIFNADKTDEFDEYIDGTSELELLNSYSTVIHELLHAFNESKDNGHNYLIDLNTSIFVPYGKYYNSKELNNYTRKGQQDSIFRYGIYIGGKSDLPGESGGKTGINTNSKNEIYSITYGIYGLLEEFGAYYYGNLAIYELFNYYDYNYDRQYLKDYKHEVLSDEVAFYEFNLFIAWYLIYAKEKHPEIYRDIMANMQLRAVYTIIDAKFRELSENIDLRMIEVNKKLGGDFLESVTFDGSDDDIFMFYEFSGLNASDLYKEETVEINGKKQTIKKSVMDEEDFEYLKEQYFEAKKLIDKEDNMQLYYANAKKSIVYLKKQYTSKINKELENFRIKGLTIENFKQFINK